MKRVQLSFKVENVKDIEELRLTRAADGVTTTMRVLPISSDIVEDAVRATIEQAQQKKAITETSQIYICTIRDARAPERLPEGGLEERVVYGICLTSEPALVEVIEPHFVKPHDVRQG